MGQEHLQKIKNKYNLIDTWRKINHAKRIYTFHNFNISMHSRIDRIYISNNIKLHNANIIHNTISDHDIISATLKINKQQPKGIGTWKLNTSILKHKSFTEIFKNFLQNWQKEKPKYKSINHW